MAIQIRFDRLHCYLSVKGAFLGCFASFIFATDRLWCGNFFLNTACLFVNDGGFNPIGYFAAPVRFTRGGFCLSDCWRACATLRFESKRGVALPAGNRDNVCFDSDNFRPP